MTPQSSNQPNRIFARWVLPIEGEPLQDAYVSIMNGVINSMGLIKDLPEEERPQSIDIDSITPGLVNVHTHLEQSVGRVIQRKDNESFADWLIQVLAVMADYQSKESRKELCRTGIKELLTSGVTCVSDIGRDEVSFQALEESGLRGVSALEFFHPDNDNLNEERLTSVIGQLNAKESSGLINSALSPHSPYNVSPLAWQYILSKCPAALIHTHLAEPEEEIPYLQGRPSTLSLVHEHVLKQRYQYPEFIGSPVSFMAANNLLNERTIATHLLELDENDLDVLVKNNVRVAHCPRSNLALHGKTINWQQWKDKNISLGLGTDGHLSTPDLDIRKEASVAIKCHGWDAQKALEVLTLGGASVLGLDEHIGSLAIGKQADIVCWQVDQKNKGLSPETQVLLESTQLLVSCVAGSPVYDSALRGAIV